VLGLSENLAQDYGTAVIAFEDGARQCDQDEAALAARCYYWAGMVSNNVGQFKQAQEFYELAQGKVQRDPERYWEFERLRLESWYFENFGKPAEDIEDAVESVERSVRGKRIPEALRASVLTVCGNVLLGAALERDHSDPAAGRLLANACRLFGNNQQRWARFGMAQAFWRRNGEGDRQSAKGIYDAILPDVIDALSRRFEDRQKILFRATAFVCHCRLEKRSDAQDGLSVILAALGDIDENSYLYSQFAMRNVKKEEFKTELRDSFQEHFP
jgi:tetratricopeptide (TPR) repeat protein